MKNKAINTEDLSITLESKIIDTIRCDNYNNNTIHFKWETSKSEPIGWNLYIITRNTRHGQLFLLHKVSALTNIDCLNLMLEYVKYAYKSELNWTVEWVKDGLASTSYFRGADEEEVLSKFNHNSHDAVVTKIKKSPLA